MVMTSFRHTRESHGERWRRRSITLPLCFTLALLGISTLLPMLLLTLVIDLFRPSSWGWSRALLFGVYYLLCECAGLLASAIFWLAKFGLGDRRYQAFHFSLQWRWARALLAGLKVVYRIDVEIEGVEALQAPGPLIVLMRHSSMADTLLPAALLSAGLGWRLRYVLKRELLWDPCLDVVGQRLPNAFVRRESDDVGRELREVQALAVGLGEREAVLIYPEGTRFSQEKHVRALERLERSGSRLLERARAFRRVLPPREGGAATLFEALPSADVVILGHVGLEGVEGVRELVDGSLLGRKVVLRCWRFPPQDRSGYPMAWLYERWAEVDAWVDARVDESGPGGASEDP